jgi:hypothetical protein
VRDVVESPVVEENGEETKLVASPPILREEISSDLKILITNESYPQLNGFGTFWGSRIG